MGKIRDYVIGVAVAAVVGWGIGSLFRDSLEYGFAYTTYHTDNFVKNNETLNGAFETLAYPSKELQKWTHGMSEEEYQDNYQRSRGKMEKILGIENEPNPGTD